MDDFNLPAAYCFCLTEQEACRLLTTAVNSRLDLRDVALRKVRADIEYEFLACHRQLISNLLKTLLEGGVKARQSSGCCLSRLCDVIPPELLHKIQEAFLSSKYVTIRRRGYKSATEHTVQGVEALVREAWELHNDPECAWLIVKTFPPSFLAENREELMSALSEGWQYARLYLRIAEITPELTEELRRIDEISFSYVVVKTGGQLSEKEAIKMVERNTMDERFGLLVWSLGRLHIWRALQFVEKQLPAIQKEKIGRLRRDYAI